MSKKTSQESRRDFLKATAATGIAASAPMIFTNSAHAFVNEPKGGSVTLAANGTFTYTPAANFNGSDSFSYTITDGTLTSTATVTLTVTDVNDVPTATASTSSGNEDTDIAVALAALWIARSMRSAPDSQRPQIAPSKASAISARMQLARAAGSKSRGTLTPVRW